MKSNVDRLYHVHGPSEVATLYPPPSRGVVLPPLPPKRKILIFSNFRIVAVEANLMLLLGYMQAEANPPCLPL